MRRKKYGRMSEINNNLSPVFNLSVVLNETGLKPDVLRVWERRYSLPKPLRSSGGHRLYSRQDIEIVKWLQARQAEGMSIKRATDLWKELVTAGQDPIKDYKRGGTFTPDQQLVEGMQMDVLRSKWLEACLAFNRHLSDDILNEAFAIYPIERICVEIFQQGLSEIGERWYHGTVTVQQEHFVTAQVLRRVEALINATPDPTRDHAIMIGCPPGEQHTYPSLFISLMLRRKGYKVIDLGADIPLDQLQQTIAAIQPDLVLMVAQQLTTAASILTAAYLLQGWGVNFAYGGLIFNRIPSLRAQIPAHFLGEDLAGALTTIESLLASGQNLLVIPGIADSQQAMATRYQESRPRIESAMFEDMQKHGISREQINNVIHYLGDRLSAALAFGDSALVQPDLEWLRGLFSTRKLPFDLLTHYLDHYSQALHKEMGETSEPIVQWMKTLVTKWNELHQ
jgi:DNA-binding transcriptional MerR regulator